MTRDGDWSGGSQQQGYQHGAAPGSPHWPEAPGAPAGMSGQATDPSRIESLLHSLINRLEENDNRYTSALNSLESRLNELSARAGTAGSSGSGAAAEALSRVGSQAADLARQVRDAEQAQRAQPSDDNFRAVQDRISDFATRIQQQGPLPAAGPSAPPPAGQMRSPGQSPDFGRQFTDTAAVFEQSLAAGQPTERLEALNARIDDLVRRFDTAVADRSDAAALRHIEAQLDNLAAQFGEAQQHYARVDAIEANLVRLMEWAQASGSHVEAAARKAVHEAARDIGTGAPDVADRLDAIQQELHALAERSRELDGRTVGALESMNSALKSLTGQITGAGRPVSKGEPAQASAAPAEGTSGRPTPGTTAKPEPQSPDLDEGRNRVGASIPDYQEKPHGASSPAGPGVRQQTGREPVGENVVAFDDDDFLASARRAAQAAAMQPGEAPKRKSLLSALRRSRPEPAPAPQESRRPRSLVVIGTVFLLVASAALLYGRLQDKVGQTAVETPGANQPAPPADVPAPSPNPRESRLIPAPPQQPEKKDESKLPAERGFSAPAGKKSAPLVIEKPAPGTGQQASNAAAAAASKPASLTPIPGDPTYSGIEVRITQPDTPLDDKAAPAPSRPAALAPAPSRPATLSVPAPEKPRHAPAARLPAKPSPRPAPRSSTAPMPPARIGPQSLRVAAARGNAAAQFEIGSRYAKGNGIKQDYGKAFEWYSRAAAQSLAPAQYRLAALYERGRGVKKDPAMARVWYTRAAEQGNVKAMHNLAVMVSSGEGRKPDHAAAAKWFTEAARLGLTDSQFNLGILYEAGLGVKKNPVEAYQWFALAAARGDKEAQKRTKRARLRLRPEQLRVADQAVRQWRPKPLDRAANDVRPPRGGWRSVSAGNRASGNASVSTTDTALVYRVQSLLNKLGYDAGVPDGVAGPKTGAAVRRFQTRIGLAVDGEITRKLLARLEALTS